MSSHYHLMLVKVLLNRLVYWHRLIQTSVGGVCPNLSFHLSFNILHINTLSHLLEVAAEDINHAL